MIRIENEKVIIEITNYDELKHDFVHDLQYDLIQLMNCVHILKNEYDCDFFFPSSFLSIMELQKALVPSVEELKITYPITEQETN